MANYRHRRNDGTVTENRTVHVRTTERILDISLETLHHAGHRIIHSESPIQVGFSKAALLPLKARKRS